MTHIQSWPLKFYKPFDGDEIGFPIEVFPHVEAERSFWSHLKNCQECRSNLVQYVEGEGEEYFGLFCDPDALKQEEFWVEVDHYLAGSHLKDELIAVAITNLNPILLGVMEGVTIENIDQNDEENSRLLHQWLEEYFAVWTQMMICGVCYQQGLILSYKIWIQRPDSVELTLSYLRKAKEVGEEFFEARN